MKIIILGAGGLARELYWHLRGAGPVDCVFVDDVTDRTQFVMEGRSVPVVKDWHFDEGFVEFLVGVGEPAAKKTFVAKALAAGLRPARTFVHPRALVQADDCSVGCGGLVAPGCILTTNIRLGDLVILNLGTTVGHDSRMADLVTCNPGCIVSGNVSLGEGVSLGTGTAVREKITVAEWVVSGAQSCIVSDILTPGVTVVGVPARPMLRR